MSEIEARAAHELVHPATGELLPVEPAAMVATLEDVRTLETRLREFKHAIMDAIGEESRRQGSKTLEIGGRKVAVSRGPDSPEPDYDAHAIEEGLRAAGMPEDRIRQIVREEISYKVSGVEAKRAARANPEYDRVIATNTRLVSKPYNVTVR